MTNQFKEELENGCKKLNIILSDRQLFQFFRYYELLLETNKVMNLTAITEEKEVIEKHFVDSLLLVRVLDQMNENSGKKEPIKERFSKGTCIDVGTGYRGSALFMEERKISGKTGNTGSSSIFVFPGRWRTYRLCLNTVFLL